MNTEKLKIAIVGLGYVGLPLAIEFGKHFTTFGFDIDKKRVSDLKNGIDKTLETTSVDILSSKKLYITDEEDILRTANVYIVTVPTPVDKFNNPDLSIISIATKMLSKYVKKGDIIIYESTVYPGVTEEFCAPIVEKISNLKFNVDFFCGYSPERINPGDKEHVLTKIKKITSGSNKEIALIVDSLYSIIIEAGTFLASSIKVAEAAKVIENSQRDINIAFMNELAKIFNLMKIDTNEVLQAAATKWNFLGFKPGLVGGHCIGVDPFYLAQKAKELGYHSEIILSGRRLNDSMASYIVSEFIKLMISNDCKIKGSRILILGVTFKENCPDIRNSKVFEIIHILESYGVELIIFDSWADSEEVLKEYNVVMSKKIENNYDGIIIAVGHENFNDFPFIKWKESGCIIYDVKSFLPINHSTSRL